jgi:hypothetical protein
MVQQSMSRKVVKLKLIDMRGQEKTVLNHTNVFRFIAQAIIAIILNKNIQHNHKYTWLLILFKGIKAIWSQMII